MKRTTIATVSALALLSPAALALAGNGHGTGPDRVDDPSSKVFELAVLGDLPYGGEQIARFPGWVDDINADPRVDMVLHVGDVKNGSTRCDTSYFEAVRAQFDRFEDAIAYTPGDNEWTDCHRSSNGGYQPAGPRVPGAPVVTGGPSRLDEIRRIFFPAAGRTLGRDARRVESQTGPTLENVRFSEARTQFGLIHVVGSADDGLPWFGASETAALRAARLEEIRGRRAAALTWLHRLFDEAERRGDHAVVVAIQADMFEPGVTGSRVAVEAFAPFVRVLATRARAFDGPVLLLDGDSHRFVADRPLADPEAANARAYGVAEAVPNLRRITVEGAENVTGYLRLRVDRKDPEAFTFERVPFSPRG